MSRRVCKPICVQLLVVLLALLLCSCGKTTWQEQYDSGTHYLSEGNYEKAIKAFTSAIKRDAQQMHAYIALADAYIGAGDYENAMLAVENGRNNCGESEALTQIERVVEFLNSDIPGVRITNLYFDEAVYLSENEADFLISVVYRCPEGEECEELRLSTNTQGSRSEFFIDNVSPISGEGVHLFNAKLAPEYADVDFKIGAELIQSYDVPTVGEDWDVLTTTPEGEVEWESLSNEYGATKFEKRQNFRDFSDMTQEEQQLVETIGNLTIEGNMGDLLDLLESDTVQAYATGSDEFNILFFYTIWNGYKMDLTFSPYGSGYEEGNESASMEVILRPENGMGYDAYIYANRVASTEGRDSWSDSTSVRWINCPCVDWQWNGTMNLMETEDRSFCSAEHNATNNVFTEISESGEMVCNLRDGAFTRTVHTVNDWTKYENMDSDSTETTTSTYQNGELITESADDLPDAMIDIYGYGNADENGNVYLDSLDALYW